MNGIIVINKPQNYTSFDVIAVLRKKLNQKKIGHMGTLDPMATGVLPVLLGSTAKFQIFTSENEKEYIAEIKFGVVTDTWDIHGKVLNQTNSNLTKDEVENVLANFLGKIKQLPPMYSAIKKNGVKLCDLARKGKEIERELRDVEIKALDLIEFNEKNQTAKIKALCSKGTYIRSLCFDIGKVLGCGASMGNLCRTLSNSFTLNDSISLENLLNLEIGDIISHHIFPTKSLFRDKNSVKITDSQTNAFKNGVNLMLSRLKLETTTKNDEILKVYNNNTFIGIGKVDLNNQVLKFLKYEKE